MTRNPDRYSALVFSFRIIIARTTRPTAARALLLVELSKKTKVSESYRVGTLQIRPPSSCDCAAAFKLTVLLALTKSGMRLDELLYWAL
jgi:hypothetical protein